MAEAVRCRFCNSENTTKYGVRANKLQKRQIYRCGSCGRRFTENDGFRGRKFPAKIITLTLDLWAGGLSIMKIKRHIKQFYNTDVGHTTILSWLREYGKIIDENTEKVKPNLSGTWSIDEVAVRFNNRHYWLWNLMHEEKKFLISSKFTFSRWKKDCVGVLEDAKTKSIIDPELIHSDGLGSYKSSIPEIFPETEHRIHSMRSKVCMNTIERLNGTCRDRITPTRGFWNARDANYLWRLWVNYYNFVKPHGSLNGMTPAEACGIKLSKEGNIWMELIRGTVE